MSASGAPSGPGSPVSRLDLLNRSCLELLGETERVAGSRAADVEAVLRALFFPDFRLSQEIPQAMRLVRRLHREPDEKPHRFSPSHLKEVIRRFQESLARALPDLSRKELPWRMHFLIGAIIHTGLCPSDLERLLEGPGKASDPKGFLKQILALAAAGLRTQLAPRPGGHRRFTPCSLARQEDRSCSPASSSWPSSGC